MRGIRIRREAATDPVERERLAREQSTVELRRLLQQFDSVYLIREVAHLRFVGEDPRLVEMVKARVFEALRSALDLGEPAIAKAAAESLLERGEEAGSIASQLTGEERGRLRRLIDEADVAFALAVQEGDD
ncbi:MAG: hypothetical protein R2862_02680 [Thermoanaerobaculia bacterium]